jgi:cell division protein FtsW
MNAPTRAEAPREAAAPFDGLLLAAVLALVALGAVMVYSASAVQAARRLGDEFWFLKRQLLAAGLGLGLLALALRVGHQRVASLAYPLLGAVVLLMLLVLVPGVGKTAGGAQRWIDLRILRFQPSEAAKVILVLYLARSLARKRDKVRVFSIGVLPHVLVTGALVLLCLAESDLGSGIILFLVMFAMLFAAGAKLGAFVAGLLVSSPLAWHFLIEKVDYRRIRVMSFLDPELYKSGPAFQLWESLLGIGNGGWLGQGLGQGKGKLFYLPAAHTDFIAAVIAEETGLLGVLLLLLLNAVVVWRGIRAARNAAEPFACYAALGLTTLLGAQALVNLAVVFGMLPTKGLTLPFVSYGGSSLLTLLAGAGILLSISGDRGGFLRAPVHAVRVAAPAAAGGTP